MSKHKINWIKVILILGLSFAVVGVHFLFTFYTLFSDDFAYLVSLLVKKAIIESVIGVCLFMIIVKYTTLEDIKKVLRDSKPYIIVSALLMVGGIVLGVVLQDALGGLFEGIFEELMGEAEKVRSIPLYQQVFFIFGNNSRVTIFSGVIAAFIPLLGPFLPVFTMFTNGVVIGLAPGIFDMNWVHFTVAILPHGVLELPALVLASAVGLKFSISMLKAVLGYFFHPAGLSGEEVFFREVKPGWQSLKLFAAIIPLLVVAALIEVFISPWVLELVRG